MVPGRGPDRSRRTRSRAAGRSAAAGPSAPRDPAHRLKLHLRRHLPRARGRRRARACHGATAPRWPCTSTRSRRPSRPARARGGSAGSGRLAHFSETEHTPANISLLPLPPKSPELNPTENVWQYMRDNWLSNRVFVSGRQIVDHCCDAWNKLIDQPWTIMSIGLRDWAYG